MRWKLTLTNAMQCLWNDKIGERELDYQTTFMGLLILAGLKFFFFAGLRNIKGF